MLSMLLQQNVRISIVDETKKNHRKEGDKLYEYIRLVKLKQLVSLAITAADFRRK